ncbi:DUF5694 domain-containing protein [Qipengyuania oceanensis]|uniref:TraB/GumN family protein n=1 Tax=Qipengyuania oceanensis TaxID=1463597 RepID=A0A844YBI4_9SPHN|nr:hypothetical protein [Qipengyuania oceanensis]
MSFLLAILAAAAAPAVSASDPVTIVDEAARKRGDRSQVLVLGTSHLRSLPRDYDRTAFDPLIERLAEWNPEAIAIESLSGAQCDYLREYDFAYDGTADGYCPDPTAARAVLGVTNAQAEQLVETMLAAPFAERPAEQRRHLAALFLAMGDPVSALVQWLRLPKSERRADESLTDPLVVELQRRADSRSEDSIIAARVAARLGLERVYAVDDHTGDRASGDTDTPVFAQEMAQIWDNDAAKRTPARFDALQAKFLADGDVLGWYRAINDEDHLRDDTMTGDFAAAAASTLPGNTGRKYLAYWETRNLRMVANLREVIGPGRRVLAIVGVSHSPYYHRYLGMTSDVELSDLGPVLRD